MQGVHVMSDMVWIRPLWRLDAGCIAVRVKRFWWSRVTQTRRGVVMSHNDRKYLRYAITYGLLALGLAAYLWLFAWDAGAQDIDSRWTLRPLAQQCIDDPSCRSTLRRPRRHQQPYYRYVAPSRNHTYYLPERGPRVYSYERRDHRGEPRRNELRCLATKEAKGPEAYTSEGALRVANRAWQSAVRSDHGERYMDVKNAGDYRWTCYRSSTNESVVGKSLEFLASRTLIRCTVWAKPCQAPVVEGIPEKGDVRKELEEEGIELTPPKSGAQFTR